MTTMNETLTITDSITSTINNSRRMLSLKLKELKRAYTTDMVGRLVEIKELDWETNQEFSDDRLRGCTGKVMSKTGIIVDVDIVDGTTDSMSDEDYNKLFNGTGVEFNPYKDLGRVYVFVEFTTAEGKETFHFNEYEFYYL